jgi:carbon monoxide dehydrogenase subunit G
MKVGLGPLTAAAFTLNVTLGELSPPERFTMTIDSKGTLGFSRGTATVVLDESGANETTMRYSAELQVGGRVAGVGQRIIESAARAMTAKGLEGLQHAIDDRLSRAEGIAGS